MPIVGEQIGAVTEETGIWQAVVFENNGFFHLAEDPVQTGGNSSYAVVRG